MSVRYAGRGYCELYVNGRKVGDRVRDPVVTRYDRRVSCGVYDVTDCLAAGENCAGAVWAPAAAPVYSPASGSHRMPGFQGSFPRSSAPMSGAAPARSRRPAPPGAAAGVFFA